MIRALIMLSGPIVAGLFVAVMYATYGNLNWGSDMERSLPWFEPTFWLLFVAGAAVLLLHDVGSAMRRLMRGKKG